METLLREPEVCKIIGYGRSRLWEDVKAGKFPGPVKVGKSAVAWPSSEVSILVAARVGSLTDEQISALVRRLLSKRKSVAKQLLAGVDDAQS